MTPETDPLAPDDGPLDVGELAVHAVLDDEATPEQRRLVAGDPALRARLEELRAVALRTAATDDDTVSDDELSAIRARALAALDQVDDPDEDPEEDPGDEPEEGRGDPGPPSPVAPLRRPRRPITSRRLPPLPAVAAIVVVLMAVGLGLILTADDEAQQTATEAASRGDEAADASSEGDDAVIESGERPPAAPTTTSPGAFSADSPEAAGGGATADESLLEFADEEQLRQTLVSIDPRTLEAPGAPPAPTANRTLDEGGRCSQVLEASDPAIETAQAVRRVLLADDEVLILSNPVAATATEPANIRLTVVEPVGCIPLLAVQR